MILVNETNSIPTHQYEKKRCTRYCHSQGCLHAAEKYATSNSSFVKTSGIVYKATIHWLGNNGSGLNYREMNLALYVVGIPLLLGTLLWGALRKD